MVHQNFFNMFSFYCSLAVSSIMGLVPFGFRIILKYGYNKYPEQLHLETICPFIIIVIFYVIFNMTRIWYYQANPVCVFFITNSEFHKCMAYRWIT